MSSQKDRSIAQAIRKRNGKKFVTTKMVAEIEQLISQRGSRTKLRYLRDSLNESLRDATTKHEELMLLLDEDDPNFNDYWIEEISLRVNTCLANISTYLRDRENDSSSSTSSSTARKQVETWLQETIANSSKGSQTSQGDPVDRIPLETRSPESNRDLTDAFSKLNIGPNLPLMEPDIPMQRMNTKSNSLPNLSEFENRRQTMNYLQDDDQVVRYQGKSGFIPNSIPKNVADLQENHTDNNDFVTKPPKEPENRSIYEPNLDNRDEFSINKSYNNKQLYNGTISADGNYPDRGVTFNRYDEFDEEAIKGRSQIYGDITGGINKNLHSTYIIKGMEKDVKGNEQRNTSNTSKRNFKYNQQRSVDSWIDELSCETLNIIPDHRIHDVQMQMLIQQRLPVQKLVTFDGSADKWVLFISNFYDMVHKQPYLDVFQKHTYLIQHLTGEPRKATDGFPNSADGYIATLKRLKYMFGNQSLVAQATIQKVTNGGQISDYDNKALTEFYYSVSACLNTLIKMNYTADIYSTDVLRQTLRRLPPNLLRKWSEYSYVLRKTQEPTLIHLENWLQARVMAAKDPYLPKDRGRRDNTRIQHSSMREKSVKCPCCNENHFLFKCEVFKTKSDREKLGLVKSKKLCFNCLGNGHGVKDCPSKRKCFTTGCNKRHHTIIHQALKDKRSENPSQRPSNSDNLSTGQINVMKNNRSVYLQVVPVKVSNPNGNSIQTYALLDSGSQCTIITKGLCQSLGLPGKLQNVQFGTIKDEETMPAKIVKVKISSIDDTFSAMVKNVYSLQEQNFNVPGQSLPITTDPKWNYIKDISFPEVKPEQVQVLIGADVPSALITNEVRKGGTGLPYASKTPLGWTLVGVHEGDPSSSCFVRHTRVKDNESKELTNLVKQFWETESFGTKVQLEEPISLHESKLLQTLDDKTVFADGHYIVPMLWKTDNPLPNNFPLAVRRLTYMLKRFQRDRKYFDKYQEQIKIFVEKGYAKKLTKEEADKTSKRTWYLPHHGVINENKPEKLRVVFDAAAKYCNQSLNSNLCIGPDLLNSLIGILLRFRKHSFAIMADIEGMFHQVKLLPEDADSHRFLWTDDPYSNKEPDQYQMLVHIMGASDSPCCASYALKRAALDQKEAFPSSVISTILRDFYMDDLIKSIISQGEGRDLINHTDKLMANAGFNLTKYNSNSRQILKDVPIDKQAKNSIVVFDEPMTRALGIKWNLKEDFLFYDVKPQEAAEIYTKRKILKKAATVFDPLGFLAPFTIKAKIILQNLWRQNLDWDEPIDEENQKAWESWLKELNVISTSIRIPRSLDLLPTHNVQLHMFCDASEKAFAAVAYIRIEEGENVRCCLLMAKPRVAPLKVITVPRLELQGAVLAVRMKETIMKELHQNFSEIFFWTDSKLNIQYINNEYKRFKVFVGNRVAEILDHSDASQWKFVPGKLNPSDLATRGIGVLDADEDSVWFNGPKFLSLPKNEWPTKEIPPLDQNCEELRSVFNTTVKEKDTFINYVRFSSWRKLVRTMGWIMEFIKVCKLKRNSPVTLTKENENVAQTKLINTIQMECFPEEINTIQEGKTVQKGYLMRLDPFIDEFGTLRVGGRLKHGDFPYSLKHQIILPSSHHAIVLLGRYYHNQHHHVGKEHLLSLLRQSFWIVGGRVMCKQIIRSCVTCQKLKAKPNFTKMSNLPEDRITAATPPFYHTGIDYFGPISVRVLRSRVKRWGCLFTCLTTRAIHLEAAPSLESDDFINVLERFVCRRGHPKLIRSDCGTNFKGASHELKKEIERMDNLKIEESLRRKQIEWQYNPPESPHIGGVWERMVRSVKTSIHAILLADRIILNDYTLSTVLVEIEALVNSRPLTPVSDDINDMEALTPNHFLMGRTSVMLPLCVTFDEKVEPRRRWKQVQSMTQQFWNRWQREYLPTLTARSKWMRSSKNVHVGDMVMVLEDSTLRGKWSIGRVIKTLPGKDDVARKVEVKMKNGQYIRPITKISLLELN